MIRFIFVLLLMSSTAIADSFELIGGGLTYHIIDNGAAQNFANKLSSDGRLIYTPEIGLRYTHKPGKFTYNSAALFRGTSSVGTPITGGTVGTGWMVGPFSLGFALGGYIQNNNDFRARGIEPFSLFGNTNAFVPIAGVEADLKIPIGEHTFLGVNNLLTPIVTNHNLSIGLEY